MTLGSGHSDEAGGDGNFSYSDIEQLAQVQHHYVLALLTTTDP